MALSNWANDECDYLYINLYKPLSDLDELYIPLRNAVTNEPTYLTSHPSLDSLL